MPGRARATPGPFAAQDRFVVTGPAERLMRHLAEARRERIWRVLFAVPGSGKTRTVRAYVERGGGAKRDGRTELPVLAVPCPNTDRGEEALGQALSGRFGVTPRMRWVERRQWLPGQLARAGVELLVVDDAHLLSEAQLRLLKWLTDEAADAEHGGGRIGLCLVCASQGGVNPLRALLDAGRDTIWRQLVRRLDAERRYVALRNHSEAEVADALAGFEAVYRAQFPALALADPWAHAIYEWLCHPVLDPERSGLVTIQHLRWLVDGSLRRAWERGLPTPDEAILVEVASLLTLRKDEVRLDAEESLPPWILDELGLAGPAGDGGR